MIKGDKMEWEDWKEFRDQEISIPSIVIMLFVFIVACYCSVVVGS